MHAMWMRRVVGSGVLALALAGCSGGSDDAPSAPPATPGTATIGQTGGRVSLLDGAEVVFPPNALGSNVAVTITRDSTGAPPLPPTVAPAGAVYAITPHGGDFQTYVEVSIPVEQRSFATDEQLVLISADPGDTGWRVLAGASFAAGRLRAPVMKFSFFQAVVLRGVVMPQLVTSIDNMNNSGAEGARQIAPDQVIEPQLEQVYSLSNTGWNPEVVARLRFPAGRLASRGGVVPLRSCLPANLDSSGAAFRYLRDGTAWTPQVRSAQVPYTAANYPRNESEFTWNGRNLDLARQSAVHFYNQDSPRVGSFGSEGVALPPANNLLDDDLLTWRGVVTFTSTDNGRVRIDATIPTDCGLSIAAAPLSFRMNWSQWSTGGFIGYQPMEPRIIGTQGSDQVLAFSDLFDLGTNFRLEYSTSPTNWQAITVPATLQPAGNVRGTPIYSVTLANLQPANAGYYRAYGCDRNTPSRCVLGAAVQLLVQPDQPRFVAQPPGSFVAAAGQLVTVFAAVGTLLQPTVRWQKRDLVQGTFVRAVWTDLPASAFSSGPLSFPDRGIGSSLQFVAKEADDGHEYRAVFETPFWTLTSDPVSLTVVDQPAAPRIVGQPASQTVASGSTAVFVVTVTGTSPLSYQWKRNGTNVPGANTASLTLNNVSAANAGSYTLQVSNSLGSATSDAAVLTIATEGTPAPLPPQVTASPASLTVNQGNSAGFAVSVSGTGPYTYAWRKNGVPIPGATAASYVIAAATQVDAGAYSVRVSNAQGSADSAAAALAVTPTPTPPPPVAPTIVTAPVGLAVLPGAGATFAVAVSGTGPINYQWKRNGMPIAGATGAVLHLGSVSGNDAGQYSVEVINAAGTAASTPVPLIVIGAPTINQQPANASVAEGSTATFTVAATGPSLLYQWTRDGVAIPGAINASYTTPPLTMADSGALYAVIVYNGAGISLSSQAVLTVTAPVGAFSWSAPVALPTTGDNGAPAAGIDAARNSLAVWANYQGGRGRITAARGSVAGAWQASAQIDGALPANADGFDPQVAVAPGGAAMAVWAYGLSGTTQFHIAAARFSGSGWTTAERLSTEFDGQSTGHRVGMDANGRAIAIWRQFNGTRRAIYARLHDGSAWSAPQLIDGGSNGGDPELAVDAQGLGWVVMGGAGEVKVAAVDLAAGTIGAPMVLAVGRNMYNARIGLGAGGNAVIAWIEDMVSGGYDLRAIRYAGSAWSPVDTLAVDVLFNQEIAVAAGGTGQAVVTWIGRVGSDDVVRARVLASGAWTSAVPVSPNGAERPQAVQVTMNAAGRSVVHWSQRNINGDNQAWARVYDGVWGEAQAVQTSVDSMQPQFTPVAVRSVAVADDGAAVLLWTEGSRGVGLRAAYYR